VALLIVLTSALALVLVFAKPQVEALFGGPLVTAPQLVNNTPLAQRTTPEVAVTEPLAVDAAARLDGDTGHDASSDGPAEAATVTQEVGDAQADQPETPPSTTTPDRAESESQPARDTAGEDSQSQAAYLARARARLRGRARSCFGSGDAAGAESRQAIVVSVTVARDGRVFQTRMQSGSGSPELDRCVLGALVAEPVGSPPEGASPSFAVTFGP